MTRGENKKIQPALSIDVNASKIFVKETLNLPLHDNIISNYTKKTHFKGDLQQDFILEQVVHKMLKEKESKERLTYHPIARNEINID